MIIPNIWEKKRFQTTNQLLVGGFHDRGECIQYAQCIWYIYLPERVVLKQMLVNISYMEDMGGGTP